VPFLVSQVRCQIDPSRLPQLNAWTTVALLDPLGWTRFQIRNIYWAVRGTIQLSIRTRKTRKKNKEERIIGILELTAICHALAFSHFQRCRLVGKTTCGMLYQPKLYNSRNQIPCPCMYTIPPTCLISSARNVSPIGGFIIHSQANFIA
jgi:hypothetical protein